ncbi:hypothetical protein EXS65_00630 [Candidatus Peribacteria bacterium]|nr:hypothetical protein [Candidatus Peribacteria bacterium]
MKHKKGIAFPPLWMRWTFAPQRFELLIFTLCIILGAFIRAYRFGEIPLGLNQDEISAGYDAYSVFRYGIDRSGLRYPMAFIAWGSGMNVAGPYFSIPFIAFLGLNTLAVRLPYLLAGIVSLWIFFALMRELCGKRVALIALFLLATNPWHIMASRWGLEANFFPPVFLSAVFFLVMSRRQPWLLIVSSLFFSFSLYAYGTSYVTVPVFLFLYALWAWRKHLHPLTWTLSAFSLFAALFIPVVLFVMVNMFHWQTFATSFFTIPRMTGISRLETAINKDLFSFNFFTEILARLRNVFQVLILGTDGHNFNALPDFGVFYVWVLPFVFFGMAWMMIRLHSHRDDHCRILWFWLVAALTMAMLINNLNINRANIFFLSPHRVRCNRHLLGRKTHEGVGPDSRRRTALLFFVQSCLLHKCPEFPEWARCRRRIRSKTDIWSDLRDEQWQYAIYLCALWYRISYAKILEYREVR